MERFFLSLSPFPMHRGLYPEDLCNLGQREISISKKKKLQRSIASYNAVSCIIANYSTMSITLASAIAIELTLQRRHSC